MVKLLDNIGTERTGEVLIRELSEEDIPIIVKSFNSIAWNKPSSLFEQYFKEVKAGDRLIWGAFVDHKFAGYTTLKQQSLYHPFNDQDIPEIMDLNVLPSFRAIGVGSTLLDFAEAKAATKSDTVGIGVGLYGGEDGGYGAAQRLYVKRGYIPNGKGVTYDYQSTIPGISYPLDDGLLLWFIKKIR